LQVSSPLLAEEPDTAPAQQSDNTKVNQRDRSNAEPTADQQKEKRSDRELARQIRRAYFVSFRPWFPTELFLVVAQNQDMAIVSFTKR
jgi:hypothetical protein